MLVTLSFLSTISSFLSFKVTFLTQNVKFFRFIFREHFFHTSACISRPREKKHNSPLYEKLEHKMLMKSTLSKKNSHSQSLSSKIFRIRERKTGKFETFNLNKIMNLIIPYHWVENARYSALREWVLTFFFAKKQKNYFFRVPSCQKVL